MTKHWEVVSPEMGEQIDIGLDDGTGPMEYGCLVVSVEASTRRKALSLAIKHPDMKRWVEEARSDGKNPFVGLRVYDPVCKHGVCLCISCLQECDECRVEAIAE